MKLKSLLLLALLIPSIVFAQDTRTGYLKTEGGTPSFVAKDGYNLVLGTEGDDDIVFTSNNATVLSIDGATGVITGAVVPTLPNNTFLKARNAANDADLDVLRVGASNITQLNGASGTNINFSINGTVEAQIGDNLINLTGANSYITAGSGAENLLFSAASIAYRIDADANRLFTFDASSDTALTLQFGDSGTTAAQTFTLSGNTSDADDDSILNLASGGATGITRGAYSTLAGNESSDSGAYRIFSGNFATADVSIAAQDDFIVETLAGTDALVIDTATGDTTLPIGNLTLSTSGKTIVIQENTASTACLGVTTPNGTTPVTVTTSCAASGARILYSRNGAITNVGTVTTTTAPNGTSFAFASTNASDTATSVVWFIIKEAA